MRATTRSSAAVKSPTDSASEIAAMSWASLASICRSSARTSRASVARRRAWARRKLPWATRIAASVRTRSENSRSTAAAPLVASPVARTATHATAVSARANATTAIAALPTMLEWVRRCRDTYAPVVGRARPGLRGQAAVRAAARISRSVASSRSDGGSRRLERLADAQRPPGRLADLVDLDPGMDRDQLELAVLRARPQDPEVGDDDRRARAGEPEALPLARPGAVADRRGEVELLDERPLRLAQQDDHLARGRRDLGRPAGARQPHLRVLVGADDGRVDVRVAVELRRPEEADVDPPGADPVVEHLGDRHDLGRGLGQVVVADRERQAHRLGLDRPGLVDRGPRRARGGAGRGCAAAFGGPTPTSSTWRSLTSRAAAIVIVSSGVGAPSSCAHASPPTVTVSPLDDSTCSSIHARKRSRSRAIPSQAL